MLRMIFCLFFLLGGALATPREGGDEGSRHVATKKPILSLEERIAEARKSATNLEAGDLEEAIKLTPFDRDVQDTVLAMTDEEDGRIGGFRGDLIFAYSDLIALLYNIEYWEDVEQIQFHQGIHVMPWEVSLCVAARKMDIFTGQGMVKTKERKRG